MATISPAKPGKRVATTATKKFSQRTIGRAFMHGDNHEKMPSTHTASTDIEASESPSLWDEVWGTLMAESSKTPATPIAAAQSIQTPPPRASPMGVMPSPMTPLPLSARRSAVQSLACKQLLFQPEDPQLRQIAPETAVASNVKRRRLVGKQAARPLPIADLAKSVITVAQYADDDAAHITDQRCWRRASSADSIFSRRRLLGKQPPPVSWSSHGVAGSTSSVRRLRLVGKQPPSGQRVPESLSADIAAACCEPRRLQEQKNGPDADSTTKAKGSAFPVGTSSPPQEPESTLMRPCGVKTVSAPDASAKGHTEVVSSSQRQSTPPYGIDETGQTASASCDLQSSTKATLRECSLELQKQQPVDSALERKAGRPCALLTGLIPHTGLPKSKAALRALIATLGLDAPKILSVPTMKKTIELAMSRSGLSKPKKSGQAAAAASVASSSRGVRISTAVPSLTAGSSKTSTGAKDIVQLGDAVEEPVERPSHWGGELLDDPIESSQPSCASSPAVL